MELLIYFHKTLNIYYFNIICFCYKNNLYVCKFVNNLLDTYIYYLLFKYLITMKIIRFRILN